MSYTAKLLIRDVVCVDPGQKVIEIARIMAEKNIGSVIVGDTQKPLGILTERDLSRRVLARGLDAGETKVSEVMTKKLITVESTETLDKVFQTLAGAAFRHLPITDEGSIVGIVSLTDLSKVLEEVYREDKYLQYFAEFMQGKKPIAA